MLPNLDTLSDIRERIATNVEQTYQDVGILVDSHTPGTGYTENVNVLSGEFYLMQQNQRWIAAQMFIDSMADDTVKRRAAEYGITRIVGNAAGGYVIAQGTNGVTIPKGRLLETVTGLAYRTTAEVILADGIAVVPVSAAGVGKQYNLTGSTVLVFVQPIAGVQGEALVSSAGLSGGANEETIARLRVRYKERLAQPPKGGKEHDYIAWAKQAHVDVTRVFVSFHEGGIGNVVLRIVTDDLASPIPSQTIIDTVAAHVAIEKPVEVPVTVQAPIARPLDLVFTKLVPNSPEIQKSVLAELDDLLREESATDSTLLLTHIRAAISKAPGEIDYHITLNDDVVLGVNELPVVGATTWPGQ